MEAKEIHEKGMVWEKTLPTLRAAYLGIRWIFNHWNAF